MVFLKQCACLEKEFSKRSIPLVKFGHLAIVNLEFHNHERVLFPDECVVSLKQCDKSVWRRNFP